MGAERHQDILYQWALRRRAGGDCGDRSRGAHSRAVGVHCREREPRDFVPGKKENKLGLRASDTAELIFEDCVIPTENLLGKEGDGFIDAMRVLDGGRISIAALSLGMAEGAYEAALKYSKQRKQFGKAISEFQAIQWKLADMATEIEAAKLADIPRGVAERCGIEEHTGVVDGKACMPAKWRSVAPTRACRFTAGTDSSRIIRRRSSIAT
jgi:alkylation response protein AidB-like acyl-CoA dehydrogenase